jgi:hypothetical protein
MNEGVEYTCPYALGHYIYRQMLFMQPLGFFSKHVTPWCGWILHATTLALIGPLLGETWPPYGLPQHSPSATRSWLV